MHNKGRGLKLCSFLLCVIIFFTVIAAITIAVIVDGVNRQGTSYTKKMSHVYGKPAYNHYQNNYIPGYHNEATEHPMMANGEMSVLPSQPMLFTPQQMSQKDEKFTSVEDLQYIEVDESENEEEADKKGAFNVYSILKKAFLIEDDEVVLRNTDRESSRDNRGRSDRKRSSRRDSKKDSPSIVHKYMEKTFDKVFDRTTDKTLDQLPLMRQGRRPSFSQGDVRTQIVGDQVRTQLEQLDRRQMPRNNFGDVRTQVMPNNDVRLPVMPPAGGPRLRCCGSDEIKINTRKSDCKMCKTH